MSTLAALAGDTLRGLEGRGTYRRMRTLEGAQAPRMRVDGREVWLFAGSNYLDLAHHPEVVEAAARAARDWGCAAGGSRLINGNLSLHEALESELADFLGAESALVFSSGYLANVGVIPALAGAGDIVVSDALNHASIVDGCRLSRADLRVFPHADVDGFAELMEELAMPGRNLLVVLDGVYSMDGDLARLAEMVPIARRYDALILVDDAHGTGTLGKNGRGTAEQLGVESEIDVNLGTLGKALGSFGAFVAGRRALRDLLVNTARSFIFSCALAPPQVAAARAALAVLCREPWRRERLAANANRLRTRLAELGISTAPSESHVLPVVIGGNEATMAVCDRLLEAGFYAQGIRHPSVPQETARLRLTPMATHPEPIIDELADAIADALGRELRDRR